MSALNSISNPMIADIGGAMESGRQKRKTRLSDEMIGEILNNTVGGKLGSLAKIDPEKAMGLAQALEIPIGQESRLRSAVGDIFMGANLLKQGIPAKDVAAILGEKSAWLEELGIKPNKYMEYVQRLSQGDPTAAKDMMAMGDAFVQSGMFKGVEDKTSGEVKKETRGALRKDVSQIAKDESTVTTNFKKIRGLTKEISKGNRSAVAQALVSLVKLGDPGSTVREGEMVNALNAESPIAAVTTLLRGNNVSSDVEAALLRQIDPLNPNTVKVEDLLATADQLVLGQVPSIQSRYQDALELAEGAELSPLARKSIFGKHLADRVSGLSSLVGGGQDKPLSDMTEEELIREIEARRANP